MIDEKYLTQFKKKNPGLTITNIVDLDNKYCVITAVKNPKVMNDNDPFFKIDKSNGLYVPYSPMEDLDKYSEALYRQNRRK